MNIGGRIKKRLEDLGWERSQLLEKLPELSPQALSNLIIRDSKRSEWDEAIANALDVPLLWLVYGRTESQAKEPDRRNPQISDDELFLLRAFRAAGAEAKNSLLYLAKTVLPDEKDFKERTGTD